MVNLGDTVKDNITGLIGIAVCRAVWMHGCIRIAVQPKKLVDGKPVDFVWVDEPQLTIIKSVTGSKPEYKHGPRPDAQRANDESHRS